MAAASPTYNLTSLSHDSLTNTALLAAHDHEYHVGMIIHKLFGYKMCSAQQHSASQPAPCNVNQKVTPSHPPW